MTIIDIHVHIQPWEQLKPGVRDLMLAGRNDLAAIEEYLQSPKAFLEFLDANEVERVGLINYPSPDLMGFTSTTNDFVANYCKADPRRLIAFGGVHPRFCDNVEAEMARLLKLGLRCLKVHPPHQNIAANAYRYGNTAQEALYRRAEQENMLVMFHGGTSIFPGARNVFADTMPIDDVAVDFPNLQIIIAHAGRPLHTETTFFLLRRHKNIHIDISGIPPKKLLEYVPRLAEIANKTLWGTDWPSPGVRDMRRNVEDFLALPIPQETKAAILSENALRLLHACGALSTSA
ncbi:amidohydrolase [candidate division KSB1 bacterium]|nr:amidohydrolase [candidate division KSB1 bacterium]